MIASWKDFKLQTLERRVRFSSVCNRDPEPTLIRMRLRTPRDLQFFTRSNAPKPPTSAIVIGEP
jgi:hypothetical protein